MAHHLQLDDDVLDQVLEDVREDELATLTASVRENGQVDDADT